MVKDLSPEIHKALEELGPVRFKGVGHFGSKHPKREYDGIRVIFFKPDLSPDQELKLRTLNDMLISRAVSLNIIPEESLSQMHVRYDYATKLQSAQNYHLTLGRINREHARKVDWSFLGEFDGFELEEHARGLHLSTIKEFS